MAPHNRRGLALDLSACTIDNSMITVSNFSKSSQVEKQHLNIGHVRALWWLFIDSLLNLFFYPLGV